MTRPGKSQVKTGRVRKQVRIYGVVQGVGFRPFVARLAREAGVGGQVSNRGSYVEVFIEGRPGDLDHFLTRLEEEAPDRSKILKMTTKEVPLKGEEDFEIVDSQKVDGYVFASPDIGTCPACQKELYDPKDPRYLHPFINCTDCGPRLTILDSMPYDRVRTSMGEFPMCPDCEWEYTHPETRRYDAQPVCCNDCGPELYLLKGGLEKPTGSKQDRDRAYIRETRRVIMDGGIVAIKGIGGFHLACDARNREAVARLRTCKARPFKPFALMMKDLETVQRECYLEEGQEDLLKGPERPILLLRKKSRLEGAKIAGPVAPDNPNVGVMLPYAPIHYLLFDFPDGQAMTDCLVMTSANPKGAPICRTDQELLDSVGPFCDLVLSHNRTIRTRADDSVVAWLDEAPYMVRRSRGYAPLPFLFEEKSQEEADREGKHNFPQVLGIGGELKNTFCLAKGSFYYPSAYVGDLTDYRTLQALDESVTRMETLLEISPQLVLADLHPQYRSRILAEGLGLPVAHVQHHYAHILSCMLENQWQDPVIGVAFDGTGYGTDGTVWGGEFLLANPQGFSRLASLAPFPQVGGDLAVKELWRIPTAIFYQELGQEALPLVQDLGLAKPNQARLVQSMLKAGINVPPSSSAGRVFDGASAILGFRQEATCEGEASMVLQFAAESYLAPQGPLKKDRILAKDRAGRGLDWTPVLKKEENQDQAQGGERPEPDLFRVDINQIFLELADRKLAGEDPKALAFAFHQAMADLILTVCQDLARQTGVQTVALSGGVMQNTLLMVLVENRLEEAGFKVLSHHLSPPNDGGICLGQAYYGMGLVD